MKNSISIIGGGASALMLAAHLDENKFDITIYEANAALGRKLLVAGDGGFNLTHSEEIEDFISRYTPSDFFENIIHSFSPNDFRHWLKSIGIETFVGTSKRVFPIKGIKPIDVLNAILNIIKTKNIKIKTKHEWIGWDKNDLLFLNNQNTIHVKSDITVFALGGASWRVTGSTGNWINLFEDKGIETIPFQASNCAVEIKWPKEFLTIAEGKALKNISVTCGKSSKKGEIVITKFGLEGGAIYALSPAIREQFKINNCAELCIDLKPSLTNDEIKNKLHNKGNKSLSSHLQSALNLSSTQVLLLKSIVSKEEFTNLEVLAKNIKNLPLIVVGLAPIDDAISTVGGIPLTEIDSSFQFKKLSQNYAIGEMLDWDAPTGGYLLQGCFSMGYKLANHLNNTSF